MEYLRLNPAFLDLSYRLAGVKYLIEHSQFSTETLVKAAQQINEVLDSSFVDNIQICVGIMERNAAEAKAKDIKTDNIIKKLQNSCDNWPKFDGCIAPMKKNETEIGSKSLPKR